MYFKICTLIYRIQKPRVTVSDVSHDACPVRSSCVCSWCLSTCSCTPSARAPSSHRSPVRVGSPHCSVSREPVTCVLNNTSISTPCHPRTIETLRRLLIETARDAPLGGHSGAVEHAHDSWTLCLSSSQPATPVGIPTQQVLKKTSQRQIARSGHCHCV